MPAFEGDFARVRCFAHIINLIAKAMLTQFDVREATCALDGELDDDVRALLQLAEDLASEEAETQRDLAEAGEESTTEDDEEWVDEVATMDDFERDVFEDEVRPVKMVLVKVRAHG